MHAIVVGAGICGLTTAVALRRKGIEVTIYEAAEHLNEIGAGVQIYPNSSRVLQHLDLLDEHMKDISQNADTTIIHRYATGEALLELSDDSMAKYGSPHWSLHRAEWQKQLYKAAVEAGTRIQFHKQAIAVDVTKPSLTFMDGTTASGDLIIGADGIRSTVRDAVLKEQGIEFHPSMAIQATYRMQIPHARMLEDAEITPLIETSASNVWYGPKSAVMGYPICFGGETQYNFVLTHKEDAIPGHWSEPGNMEHIKQCLADFEPRIQAMLARADKPLKWGLSQIPPLKRWSSQGGKVVLAGDAAHAMVPHIGQGGSQAIEDAAILGESLGRAVSLCDIPQAVMAYEKTRKPRAEIVAHAAMQSMETWLLEDGAQQRARDEALRATQQTLKSENAPTQTPDKDAPPSSAAFREWLFRTDVIADFNEQYAA